MFSDALLLLQDGPALGGGLARKVTVLDFIISGELPKRLGGVSFLVP